MSSRSGLLKVENLTVTGTQAGAVTAVKINASSISASTVNADTFTYDSLDLSGNLMVRNSAQINVLSVGTNATLAGVKIATVNDISGAIAVLTNGADSTLDTLLEIDNYIKDTSNNLGQVLTTLSYKAPLANPKLTGNVDVSGNLSVLGGNLSIKGKVLDISNNILFTTASGFGTANGAVLIGPGTTTASTYSQINFSGGAKLSSGFYGVPVSPLLPTNLTNNTHFYQQQTDLSKSVFYPTGVAIAENDGNSYFSVGGQGIQLKGDRAGGVQAIGFNAGSFKIRYNTNSNFELVDMDGNILSSWKAPTDVPFPDIPASNIINDLGTTSKPNIAYFTDGSGLIQGTWTYSPDLSGNWQYLCGSYNVDYVYDPTVDSYGNTGHEFVLKGDFTAVTDNSGNMAPANAQRLFNTWFGTTKKYKNYQIQYEAKIEATDGSGNPTLNKLRYINGGVSPRMSISNISFDTSNYGTFTVPYGTGLQFELGVNSKDNGNILGENFSLARGTGGILGVRGVSQRTGTQSPYLNADEIYKLAGPPNSWASYKIELVNNVYRYWINGVMVNKLYDQTYNSYQYTDNESGFLAIQGHVYPGIGDGENGLQGAEGHLYRYRNIRVKELPNGTDTSGGGFTSRIDNWLRDDSGNWFDKNFFRITDNSGTIHTVKRLYNSSPNNFTPTKKFVNFNNVELYPLTDLSNNLLKGALDSDYTARGQSATDVSGKIVVLYRSDITNRAALGAISNYPPIILKAKEYGAIGIIVCSEKSLTTISSSSTQDIAAFGSSNYLDYDNYKIPIELWYDPGVTAFYNMIKTNPQPPLVTNNLSAYYYVDERTVFPTYTDPVTGQVLQM